MDRPEPPNPMDPSLGGPPLVAPWRLEYIESLGDEPPPVVPPPGAMESLLPASPAAAASFLRDYWDHPADDERNHVVARLGAGDEAGMLLLNAYPYANGHLLAALGDGRPSLLDYSAAQRAALWRLTDVGAALMQATLAPQGINIGVNQGRAAGAGLPGHLHVHLVPRWHGDVNFMAVVGRVRVIPSSLDVMARRYREAWTRIRSRWER
jgi:ATP adenylyltransferase